MSVHDIKIRIYNLGYPSVRAFCKEAGIAYSTLQGWAKSRPVFVNYLLNLMEKTHEQ